MAPRALFLTLLLAATAVGCGDSYIGPPTPSSGPYAMVIHVLEAADYKPVSLWVSAGELPVTQHSKGWYVKTDKYGTAVLHLPDPAPLGISVHVPSERTCSQIWFCTQNVMSKGIVADDKCWGPLNPDGKPRPQLTATPGEVYVFLHQISRWSWGWHETFGGAAGPFVKIPFPDIAQCPAVTVKPPRPGK